MLNYNPFIEALILAVGRRRQPAQLLHTGSDSIASCLFSVIEGIIGALHKTLSALVFAVFRYTEAYGNLFGNIEVVPFNFLANILR